MEWRCSFSIVHNLIVRIRFSRARITHNHRALTVKFVIEIKSDKCFYCIARISYIYLNLAHWIITHVFVIRISIRFIFHLFFSPFFRSIDATACGMMQSTYNRFMPMIDYSLAAGICNLFVIGTTKLIGFHSPFLCALFKQKAKVTVKHINLLNSCHYGQ